MNDEKLPESNRRLLHDVLQDEAGHAAADAAKYSVMAAFRRRQVLKRVTRMANFAVGLAVLLTGSFALRMHLQNSRSAGQPGHEIAAQQPTVRTTIPPLPTLTDEELLASFPSDACYLAEVDGRKILVFIDADVRKKFLH